MFVEGGGDLDPVLFHQLDWYRRMIWYSTWRSKTTTVLQCCTHIRSTPIIEWMVCFVFAPIGAAFLVQHVLLMKFTVKELSLLWHTQSMSSSHQLSITARSRLFRPSSFDPTTGLLQSCTVLYVLLMNGEWSDLFGPLNGHVSTISRILMGMKMEFSPSSPIVQRQIRSQRCIWRWLTGRVHAYKSNEWLDMLTVNWRCKVVAM